MEKKLAAYICTGCGLGEALDIEELNKVATSEYKVPICKNHPFLCSPEGVELIRKDIADEGVNTLIIAGCSPRVMYDVFDFEGCVMDRVNLREQVLWSMEPPKEDTGEDDDDDVEDTQAEDIQMMAEDYIRMGITKVKKME
ncbi:MAG: heterodisulfide reductase subunit A, partial [Thermodesulfobacteriota bacterium]|nr:heterodisulfide reductase subunit A [Thermodesulfobacteriota bacterium]